VKSETVEFKKEKYTAITTRDYVSVDASGNWTEMRETSTLRESGRIMPLGETVQVRRIEYYE
jgi:hypothetical protein